MKKTLLILLFFISTALSGVANAVPVNINTADAVTLAKTIKGVGPKRAAAIVEYREAHGPFKSVDDLRKVEGVGAIVLETNRENLTASME